ncbi:unnamed protein product, partial [Oppiella nova]
MRALSGEKRFIGNTTAVHNCLMRFEIHFSINHSFIGRAFRSITRTDPSDHPKTPELFHHLFVDYLPLNGTPCREEFLRHELPPNTKPDALVFVCKATREAFLTYDEFFERQILCSSMVWTCATSGRTGLTYGEALESERASAETLQAFPTALQIPSLFLVRYLRETSINAIVDMIYQFINNRYFMAEDIEIIVNTKRKMKGKVFRVIPPTPSEVTADERDNREISSKSFGVNPALYKYELIDGERRRHIMGAERVTRAKGLITKDKLKLYLKQHLVQTKRTDPWTVSADTRQSMNLSVISWDNMFAGPEPNFADQTMIVKTFNKDKHKAILDSKRGSAPGVSRTPIASSSQKLAPKSGNKKSAEKAAKTTTTASKEAPKQTAKERERERKLRQRLLEREQKRQFEENMKEWNTKRDDLACDDLRPLPEATPLKCGIPVDLFGATVAVMEFLHCFDALIDLRPIFPFGVTLELMEQIVTDVDINGPYGDLVKVLVTTNLTLQREDEEVAQDRDDSSDDEGDESSKPTTDDDKNEMIDGDKNAVYYYNWIQMHFGVQLSQLSLDPLNITEVLRLYLLSSGGGPQPRSKYRGLYQTREDPSVEFVAKNGDILETLELGSIFDLKPAERLQVLDVLVLQLMSYFEFRDRIDDSFDEMSKLRKKIRDIQTEFNKWTKDNSLKRLSVKGTDGQNNESASAASVPTPEQLEEYRKEKAHKEADMSRSCGDIRAQIRRLQACYGPKPIGQDRAFRKYWLFESLPGLFVEHSKPNTQYTDMPFGPCLPEPTPNKSLKPRDSTSADNKRESSQSSLSDDISTTSDKENDSKSASETYAKDTGAARRHSAKLSVFDKCTANMTTCAVHGLTTSSRLATEWQFYYSTEQLTDLVESLNCRGFRESELIFALNRDRHIVDEYVNGCQPHRLNRDIPAPPEGRRSQRIQQVFHSRKGGKHSNVGLGYSECIVKSMRDYLFHLEERVVSASLAVVNPVLREEWQRVVDGEGANGAKQTLIERYAKAILMLRQCVRPMCLSEQLSDDSPVFNSWRQSLRECASMSQLFVHLSALELGINWCKSALKAFCKICRRKCDAENMLLCDQCNRGHHTYCLQPALESIPAGEWLCPECCPKFKPQTPKKGKHVVVVSDDSDGEDTRDSDDDND